MKPTSIPFRHIVALTLLLLGITCITSVADETIPRIAIDNAPLSDTIKTLARQSNLNLILDPRVVGADSAKQPSVSMVWTNTTAKDALTALLNTYNLKMVSSPATTVTRIVPASAHVEPVSAETVGTKESKTVPLMALDDVPLADALKAVGVQAGINFTLDEKTVAPALEKKGSVSIRWEKISPRQAFAALLDNYDLVIVTEGSADRLELKPKKD